MGIFKRILSYGKPYGRYWPGYLALSVLSLIFGIANYALLGPLLTVLFESQDVAGPLAKPEFALTIDWAREAFRYAMATVTLEHGALGALSLVCGALIFCCFVADLCRYLSQRILVGLKTNIMKNIRADLFHKVSRMEVGSLGDRRKGDILSSISNDVAEVQNSVAGAFHIIFREPLLVVGFLAMLFYMSPRLTAVSLVALPVCAVFVTRLTRKLRAGSVETQSLMGSIISHFEETLSGLRIIKAFGAEKYVEGNFEKTNEAHREASRRVFNRQELASPTSEFLGISIGVLVLFYGGWLNIHGNLGMSWQEFVVYIMFYWKVLEPAKAIANSYAGIQKGIVSGERIFAILDTPVSIEDGASSIKHLEKEISFENVTFSYTGESDVLHNVSFSIPKGSTVALVGSSGAGKSTIADLVPRFWDVTSGRISIDGTDIRLLRISDLTGLLGIVSQETILFNDTIFNNIVFGKENVSPEEVYAAARAANAEEFILRQPQGYNTNIGDRGSKLSGGERQRIAIARALLKDPEVLILDEATSALDTQNERLVQEALSKLMAGRTSLVIAHRLSTIRTADEILVLRGGEIVERGNHEKLIAKDGVYSHLCNLQNMK